MALSAGARKSPLDCDSLSTMPEMLEEMFMPRVAWCDLADDPDDADVSLIDSEELLGAAKCVTAMWRMTRRS